MKSKWLAILVATMMTLSLAVGVAVANPGQGQGPPDHAQNNNRGGAGEDCPAAPAVAAKLLSEAGVNHRYGEGPDGGNYVSDVAREMGPGTDFDEVEKCDEDAYREAVAEFLNDIDPSPGVEVPEPVVGEGEVWNETQNEYYETIQGAIDEADEDDTILVGPGEYEEDIKIDVENLILEGPNAGIAGDDPDRDEEATIISTHETYGIEIGDKVGAGAPANGAEFRGFELLGADVDAWTGIGSNSHDIIVEDNVVKDFRTGFTSGLASSNVDEITFILRNNLFEGHVSAISTEGGYNAIIENNKIYNNRNGIGFNADDTFEWSIVGNDFLIDNVEELEANFDSDARYVSNRGELEGESAEYVIELNDFDPAARFAVEVDNTTNIVPEGSGEVPNVINIDQNTVFDEIQPALNEAEEGDTIEVAAGTYVEEVTVDIEGLMLKGSQERESVIEENIKVSAADVTISRFELASISGDPDADNLTISNNLITGLNLEDNDHAFTLNHRVDEGPTFDNNVIDHMLNVDNSSADYLFENNTIKGFLANVRPKENFSFEITNNEFIDGGGISFGEGDCERIIENNNFLEDSGIWVLDGVTVSTSGNYWIEDIDNMVSGEGEVEGDPVADEIEDIGADWH